MASKSSIAGRLKAQGMRPFSPEAGLRLLEQLLQSRLRQALALAVDWPSYLNTVGRDELPDLLAEWIPRARPILERSSDAGLAEKKQPLSKYLQEADPEEALKLLRHLVREAVLRVLELDAAFPLDDRHGFRDLGMDSLLSVELKNHLQASLGCPLPATLAFDYPNVAAVTDFLSGMFLKPRPASDGLRASNEDRFGTLLAELDQLSDAEAEAYLIKELTRTKAEEPK
jgi:acyl carrier protein